MNLALSESCFAHALIFSVLVKFGSEGDDACVDAGPGSGKAIIIGAAVGGSLGAVMMIIAAMWYWKTKRDTQYLLLTVKESK